MPVQVARVIRHEQRTIVVIDAGSTLYRLALQRMPRFNSTELALHAWLRKQHEVFLTEDEAIAIGIKRIEQLEMPGVVEIPIIGRANTCF